jgi:hypothetical protein
MTKCKRPHLYPTRKWWAAQITATTTLAVAWVDAGRWDKPLSIAAIGVVSQAAVTYLVPNSPTPPAGPRSRSGRRGSRQPATSAT